MLSHPLEEGDWAALDFAQFSAEWKWDGIRVQLVAGGGEAQLFSRAGDADLPAFPDIVPASTSTPCSTASCWCWRRRGAALNVAPFNDLQQRLNRKAVSKKQLSSSRPMSASTMCW